MERKVGRPCKYLQKKTWETWLDEDWDKLVTNDIPHLQSKLKWVDWKITAVLGAGTILIALDVALLIVMVQWFYRI